MGWQISCIISSERQFGYLGTSPEHSAPAGRNLIRKMKIPVTNTTSFVFFETGIDAIDRKRCFCLGVYEGAALIAGIPDLIGTVEQENNEFIQRFVALYPKASVFAFDLNSGTNYFAYVLFENSILRRKVCGDATRGLVLNEGAVLEEEAEAFRNHGNQDFVKNGEALAFNICKRFFGFSFDEFDGEKLHVEIVRSPGPVLSFVRKFLK
jgi:hypothetical protein